MPKPQLWPHRGAMKLRIGQAVHSTDGVFGELADIVVDPTSATVTHIVVEPSKQHHQARLVPIWLVSVEDETVNIALAAPFVRQLQRVAFDDFMRAKGEIAVGDQWDVGKEDLIVAPFWDAQALPTDERLALDLSGTVSKADCEIRRRSEVTTSDFHVVGHVEGFITSGSHLIGCVVVTGILGRRHHKIVPMDLVDQVYDREIILRLGKAEFAAIPRSPGLDLPGLSPNAVVDLRTKRMSDAVRDSASRLAARSRHRYHRSAATTERDRVDS